MLEAVEQLFDPFAEDAEIGHIRRFGRDRQGACRRARIDLLGGRVQG